MRLRMNYRNQLIVSAPVNLSNRKILSFVESQRLWLKENIAHAPKIIRVDEWLQKNPFLSANGTRFPIQLKSTTGSRANYTFESSSSAIKLHIPGQNEDACKTLLKLVKAFSKDTLGYRLAYHTNNLNLKYERLTVRDQISRWGSCSNKRCISLNWRLILIEPELQDYVILHELAHLTEMNHSKQFWKLLDSYDPLRSKHEFELKKVADTVMRVGRD